MTALILTNRVSVAAQNLQTALHTRGVHVARATLNSRLRNLPQRCVINLGVSQPPPLLRDSLFSNGPPHVPNCTDKRRTFFCLEHAHVPTLEWSTLPEIAEGWLGQQGRKVVVRHDVSGHSGAGIEIVRLGEELPQAPLYTKYFKKRREFRVHVAFGSVIHVQQKRKMRGFDHVLDDRRLVRTHGNGWIFSVDVRTMDMPKLHELALSAARAVVCNHCAVDILEAADGTQVVCEINSAPGMEAPSVINAYAEAFTRWLKEVG